MVVFAQHNVIKDAPFTRVDLVSCRNLLIYLQPAAQQKVLSLFHFALNRGGCCSSARARAPGALARDFETRRQALADLPQAQRRAHPGRRAPAARPPTEAARRRGRARSPPAARYSLSQLLGTYDALLDESCRRACSSTSAASWSTRSAARAASCACATAARGSTCSSWSTRELKMVLVGGLQARAARAGADRLHGRPRLDATASSVYKVTVRRVAQPRRRRAARPGLVRGDRGGRPRAAAAGDRGRARPGLARPARARSRPSSRYTKENLQAAIEELETSNEELQAANEELLASNEELQSTNEELQSVNEELYTVNAEYQRKIARADRARPTTWTTSCRARTIGTIFLDRELRIRKFTPQSPRASTWCRTTSAARSRRSRTRWTTPSWSTISSACCATGAADRARAARSSTARSFFLRILPYRAKGAVDGVVLTLIDVSGLKAAEDALFHERYLLNSLLVSVPDAIYFKDARGRFIRANHAMATRLGLDDPARRRRQDRASSCPTRRLALALHQQDEAVLRTGEAQHYKLERRATPTDASEWDLVTRLPLRDRDGAIVGIIGDLPRRHRAEAAPRRRSRRRCGGATSSWRCSRTSCATRSARSSPPPRCSRRRGAAAASTRQLLDILERQSQQMARLLDDLLEASRVTQNKIELKKRVDRPARRGARGGRRRRAT